MSRPLLTLSIYSHPTPYIGRGYSGYFEFFDNILDVVMDILNNILHDILHILGG